MEKRLQSHWTEFDRMVRRLGALRRERDGLLGKRTTTSPSRVVAAFGEAVAAVCRSALTREWIRPRRLTRPGMLSIAQRTRHARHSKASLCRT
jgi:hypothetical protein